MSATVSTTSAPAYLSAFAVSAPLVRRPFSVSLQTRPSSRLALSPNPHPFRTSPRLLNASLAGPPNPGALSAALRDIADTSGTSGFMTGSRAEVQTAWVRHRGRARYVRHVLGFPFSKLGKRLAPLSAVAIAECVAMAAWEAHTGVAPHFGAQPVGFVSAIVGLLLSFRTNASLGRYYEARGAWQTVVSKSSDICRIGDEYLRAGLPATELSPLSGELRTAQLTR